MIRMLIARYRCAAHGSRVGVVGEDHAAIRPLTPGTTLADVLFAPNPAEAASARLDGTAPPIALAKATLLPPIEAQEVWAAGVTYRRSKAARMEESDAAASCYDRVYEAERPELFFKATPHRVSGPGEALRIRADSSWNVPEPELALALDPALRIVGYTIGNDMSSRSIEGENPLYLPQAKVYDQCCGLGPWIALADTMPAPTDLGIRIAIERDGATAFAGDTRSSEITRSFADLASWLGRDNSFPNGAFLLTGTGIVPDADFTLAAGDVVRITIDGIGTLTNAIV